MSHVPPILFVHGMYMNAHSWKPWIARATQRGLVATAVSWPYHQGEPQERREHIDPRLGRLTFGAVVASLKAHIDDMPEQPILIGHSVGGLAVQKLLNDGYGRAGVAISPAPPLGVLSLAPDFFKANWPHLDPFAGDRPIVMTKERFHFTFCNTMTRDESDAAYDLYVVPESRNVPRTTLTPAGAHRLLTRSRAAAADGGGQRPPDAGRDDPAQREALRTDGRGARVRGPVALHLQPGRLGRGRRRGLRLRGRRRLTVSRAPAQRAYRNRS